MYMARTTKKRSWRSLMITGGVLLLVVLAGGGLLARHAYLSGLEPVGTSNEAVQMLTVEKGATLDEITKQLEDAGLIRSPWAFKLYVGSKGVRNDLQAGTYSLSASQTVAQIVVQLTHGKVTSDLVTIIPGQRIEQIKRTLINYGFSEADVATALDPSLYSGYPVLADKPAGASLEGFIYPDSYHKDSGSTPQKIISQALTEMEKKLTPDLRSAFAAQGLSTYEAITIASIVEKEVSNADDRPLVAQVFLKRHSIGMQLGSDVTAFYGAYLAGVEPSVSYDTPYNTRMHEGLPPTPISNVTLAALQAVANPAKTDWLFFVSGDDGTTHFSKTFQEHESNVVKYCTKLCGR